jgi:hypothetical protein
LSLWKLYLLVPTVVEFGLRHNTDDPADHLNLNLQVILISTIIPASARFWTSSYLNLQVIFTGFTLLISI